MMFQPRSGTDTILDSVDIVTSYLKTPFHRSTVLWIFTFQPMCTNPPSHPPPWDWSAPLFAPDFPPSFRSCTAWTNNHPLPPDSTGRPALTVLPPSTCSPVSCCPLQPRAASPFLTPCPPSGHPPLMAASCCFWYFQPVREVFLNYEVVDFQPQTLATPDLGSVAYCYSLI